jgi:regulator of sigma E protease
MWGIIVFIIVLSLVIIIHELGHFLAARRAGILCHEFSLGMGPVLYSKKVGETTYCIRAIPLGGYVSMAGEEVNSEIVKVGNTIRISLNESNKIDKIIIDHENELYQDYELITVEKIDLSGLDDKPLMINEYKVETDALYVLKKQEIQIAPADRNFNFKNKRQRFLAIFGGPFMNFVLAFFIFVLYALILGFPNMESSEIGNVGVETPAEGVIQVGDVITEIDHDPVTSWDDISVIMDDNLGDRVLEVTVLRDGEEVVLYITPTITFYNVGFHSAEDDINSLVLGEVFAGSKADAAGLKAGDRLISIDGSYVTYWSDVIDIIGSNTDGESMTFKVFRSGQYLEFTIEEPWNQNVLESQGFSLVETRVGIGPVYEFDFVKSVGYGFVGIKESSTMIFDTLRLLFSDDQVSAGDLAGPLGIYQITNSALQEGFLSLLAWIGLLSVNLGVINLLPIPALDGGRLVFLGWEAVTGKKANPKVENTLHYVMYLMLMGLFLFITYNDLLRLLNLK